MYACMNVGKYVVIYEGMYVCRYVRMHVCSQGNAGTWMEASPGIIYLDEKRKCKEIKGMERKTRMNRVYVYNVC